RAGGRAAAQDHFLIDRELRWRRLLVRNLHSEFSQPFELCGGFRGTFCVALGGFRAVAPFYPLPDTEAARANPKLLAGLDPARRVRPLVVAAFGRSLHWAGFIATELDRQGAVIDVRSDPASQIGQQQPASKDLQIGMATAYRGMLDAQVSER